MFLSSLPVRRLTRPSFVHSNQSLTELQTDAGIGSQLAEIDLDSQRGLIGSATGLPPISVSGPSDLLCLPQNFESAFVKFNQFFVLIGN